AVATPSPLPTARPTLDAATRFGAVHTAALPAVDEQSTWWPTQLIPGSHLFVISKLSGYLPCEVEGCQWPPPDPQNPAQIALWNFDTGSVEPLHTLRVGSQLPATGSDGHYFAWTEGCDHGMGGPWDLYAMDLRTGESWYVDSDFASKSGDSELSDVCPNTLTITDGKLIYSTVVANVANLPGSFVFEVRAYDLAERTGSVLPLSGEYSGADIGCSACGKSEEGLVSGFFEPLYSENGQVFWTGSGEQVCSTSYTCTTPNALYVTDVLNGNTARLTSGLDHGGLLQFLTGGSQGRDEAGSRWQNYVQVVGNFVLWVDLAENSAMAYDVKSGDLTKLNESDCSAGLVTADDQAIYWTCGDQLQWVDLPQP
ncbi:MAG: hypothetical protein ABR978_08765, partial [Dehalococcoidia bacterium]